MLGQQRRRRSYTAAALIAIALFCLSLALPLAPWGGDGAALAQPPANTNTPEPLAPPTGLTIADTGRVVWIYDQQIGHWQVQHSSRFWYTDTWGSWSDSVIKSGNLQNFYELPDFTIHKDWQVRVKTCSDSSCVTTGDWTSAEFEASVADNVLFYPGGGSTSTACNLYNAIIAANTDSVSGNCPAGASEDNIELTADITLVANLPDISSDITIEGDGVFSIDGDDAFRMFNVTGGRLVLNLLRLVNARATAKGAVLNLGAGLRADIDSSTISGARLDEDANDGEQSGAAIYMSADASLNVNNSTIEDSRAVGTQLGVGGAILMESGTLNIANSHFANNQASGSGGAIRAQGGRLRIHASYFVDNQVRGNGKGGAIENDGGTVAIENSTFAGNQTSGSDGRGGAIHSSSGSLSLRHVTINGSQAGDSGRGAGLEVTGGKVWVFNSIIAGSVTGADCVGSLEASSVGNLIEDGTCSPALSGDPSLGPLDTFSVAKYYTLNPDSAAIDAADKDACEGLLLLITDEDARGAPRPQPTGGACDIGAYEWVSPTDVIFKETACHLADAVTAANTDTATNFCPAGQADANGPDLITLTRDTSIALEELTIDSAIQINGAGYTLTNSSAGATRRFFNISEDKSLFLINIRLQGGSASTGGAIFNGGSLVLINSALNNNTCTGATCNGGAIEAGSTAATTAIKGTTFFNNSALGNGGAIATQKEMAVENSTFYNNQAQNGGAIAVLGTESVILLHVTLNMNTASNDGNAIHITDTSVVGLVNSVIAGSASGAHCHGFDTADADDDTDTITVAFIQDKSCSASLPATAGDSPGLGDLTTFSDKPNTYTLLDDSPLIDAADATGCASLDPKEDQVGTSRPQPTGDRCDIGAYEKLYEPGPTNVTLNGTACHLRDAIIAAESDAAYGFCPAGQDDADGTDIITLTADITLTASLPEIDTKIAIDGAGFIIDGADSYRIFNITGGEFTLTEAGLRNARAVGGGGAIRMSGGSTTVNIANSVIGGARISPNGSGESFGGAIFMADGTLNIRNSAFRDNQAKDSTSAEGGAIYMKAGALSITNSVFSENESVYAGGAIVGRGGTLAITGSAFINNNIPHNHGAGGAIDNGGAAMTIANSVFYGNMTSGSGEGGAIRNSGGRLTLRHVTISGNETGNASFGAGLHVSVGTVKVFNSIIANSSGGSDCRGSLHSDSTGNLIEDNTCSPALSGDPALGDLVTPAEGGPPYLPLKAGSAAIDAADDTQCDTLAPGVDQIGTIRPQPTGGNCDIGAIEWMPPPNVIFEGVACHLHDAITASNSNAKTNFCPAGSGPDTITLIRDIALQADLPTVTTDIVIEGEGFTISGDSDGDGVNDHPIFVTSGGHLTVNNLTMTHGKGDPGGALLMKSGTRSATINNSALTYNTANGLTGSAVYASNGTLTITNSTISQNGGEGASSAIFQQTAAREVTLTHVTIVNNQGGDLATEGKLKIRNSIIGACHKDSITIPENVNNIVMSTGGDCANFEFLDGDPKLGELTGSPAYHPIGPGSAALDAAAEAHCTATDQRGVARPQRSACDIGAYEYKPAPPSEDEAIVSGMPEPPLNLRIEEMSPLMAMWDKPRGGVNFYLYRIRKRPVGSGDWEFWGAWRATTKTKIWLSPKDYAYFDWQIAVKSIRDEMSSAASDAFWGGRPVPATCAALPEHIAFAATYGIGSGIQCTRHDARLIGIDGALEAVDVWGYVEQGVAICFRSAGSLVFLDAATSPRTMFTLPPSHSAGMTCAYLNRPGTVVLLPASYFVSAPEIEMGPPAPGALAAATADEGLTELEQCRVTTLDLLNFRETPGGRVKRVLPADATLAAQERVGAWFRVTYVGDSGWISADWVRAEGDCG